MAKHIVGTILTNSRSAGARLWRLPGALARRLQRGRRVLCAPKELSGRAALRRPGDRLHHPPAPRASTQYSRKDRASSLAWLGVRHPQRPNPGSTRRKVRVRSYEVKVELGHRHCRTRCPNTRLSNAAPTPPRPTRFRSSSNTSSSIRPGNPNDKIIGSATRPRRGVGRPGRCAERVPSPSCLIARVRLVLSLRGRGRGQARDNCWPGCEGSIGRHTPPSSYSGASRFWCAGRMSRHFRRSELHRRFVLYPAATGHLRRDLSCARAVCSPVGPCPGGAHHRPSHDRDQVREYAFNYSEYPPDGASLPDSVHIRRSFGGAGGTVPTLVIAVLLWLRRLRAANGFTRWFLAFVLLDSVLLFIASAVL